MENLTNDIRKLVQEVIEDLNIFPETQNTNRIGVFSNINTAILAAEKAYKIFKDLSLEIRKDIIESIRKI